MPGAGGGEWGVVWWLLLFFLFCLLLLFVLLVYAQQTVLALVKETYLCKPRLIPTGVLGDSSTLIAEVVLTGAPPWIKGKHVAFSEMNSEKP